MKRSMGGENNYHNSMDGETVNIGLDNFTETRKDFVLSNKKKLDEKTRQISTEYSKSLEGRFRKMLESDDAFVLSVERAVGLGNVEELQEIAENTLGERNDFAKFMVDLQKRKLDIDSQMSFIEAEYKSYLLENIELQVLDVITRYDVDLALANSLKPNTCSTVQMVVDLKTIKNVWIRLLSDEEMDLDEIYHIKNQMDEMHKRLSDADLLLYGKSDDVNMDVDIDAINSTDLLKLQKKVNLIISDINEYQNLSLIYKDKQYSDKPSIELKSLYEMLKFLSILQEDGDDFLDSKIMVASERWILKKTDDLRTMGLIGSSFESRYRKAERLKKLDKQKIISGVEVYLGDGIKYFTEEEFVDEIVSVIPSDLLKRFRSISFVNAPKSGANKPLDDISDEGEDQGVCEHEFDADGYKYSRIKIYLQGFELDTSLKTDKKRFVSWHELGHVAHMDMNLDEMRAWERVTTEHPISLTTYVEKIKSKGQNIRAKREDFSESFAMFLYNPAYLKIVSPERYSFMHDLFILRGNADEIEEISQNIKWNVALYERLLKDGGISEEMVKSEFSNGVKIM